MTPTHEDEVCEPEEPVIGPQPEPAPIAGPQPQPASVDRMLSTAGGPRTKERPILEHYTPLRFAWPGGLDFEAELGGQRERFVDVWNEDGVPRTVFSTYINGSSAFTVSKAPTVVPARSSARIAVTFAPQVDGMQHATLQVAPERGVGASKDLIGHATRRETVTPASPTSTKRIEEQASEPVATDNTKNTWRLAGPPTIDLGDNLVGVRTRHTTSVFALDREQGPRIRARVVGDASIRLLQSPLFLPGTRSDFQASNEFKLEHVPSKRGVSSSTLEIEILDAPHETFRYPIAARSHEAGEPTHEEEAAANRARDDERERNAEAAAARRENERLGKQRGTAEHFTKEDERDFELGLSDAKGALYMVFERRRNGIDTAGREIGEFARKKPAPEQPSRLEQLAWMALDLASAAFAGGLAKAIEPAVSKILSHTVSREAPPSWQDPLGERGEVTSNPSKAIVGAITDGAKHIVKTSLKKGKSPSDSDPDTVDDHDSTGVATSSTGQTYATASTNPEAAYLAIQADSLVLDREAEMPDVVAAYRALWPTFRVDPQRAISAMSAIASGIRSKGEHANAIQTEHTVRKWVQYVAETAGIGDATRTFDGEHPLEAKDGLIDVQVTADHAHPENRVKIVGARIDGLRHDVVKRLRKQRLIDLGLPVRVATNFNSPSQSLTVTRHANGNVDFSEDTTSRDRAQWLARKAAAGGRGPDAIAGARLLIESEVMVENLEAVPVKNDSAERRTKR